MKNEERNVYVQQIVMIISNKEERRMVISNENDFTQIKLITKRCCNLANKNIK